MCLVGATVGRPSLLPIALWSHNSGVDIQLLGPGLHSENTQVFATPGLATQGSAVHATGGPRKNGGTLSILKEEGEKPGNSVCPEHLGALRGIASSLVRGAPPSRPRWDLLASEEKGRNLSQVDMEEECSPHKANISP